MASNYYATAGWTKPLQKIPAPLAETVLVVNDKSILSMVVEKVLRKSFFVFVLFAGT